MQTLRAMAIAVPFIAMALLVAALGALVSGR